MLAGLAHLVHRHRRAVVGVWLVLTLFGAFAANQVSKRWFQSFSIPGYSAYETNQRALRLFGTGEQAPQLAVFHSSGDVTKERGIATAIRKAQLANKGSRVSSYFSTGSDAYVSRDRHTTFMEIYPPGSAKFDTKSGAHAHELLLIRGAPRGRLG